MRLIFRCGIHITLLVCALLCAACAQASGQPFIIDERAYQDKFISVEKLPQTYIYNQAINLDTGLSISVKAELEIPSIEVTSFTVAPTEFDINKLIRGCMDVDMCYVECTETREGFQCGRLYTLGEQALAINDDDAFFTFFRTEQQETHISDASILSDSALTTLTLNYLKKCGLEDNICEIPEKIVLNPNSGLYEVTFGKSYYGLRAETRSYTNIASTQGFPVDGEFITLCVSANGIESFNGILKGLSQIDPLSSVISLDAIIDNFDRYVDLVPFAIGDHLTINHIELKYVATPISDKMWSSRYVLAWKFTGSTDENIPYFLYVNALDGTIVF